ncbi:lipoyl(octanoyl) transferase LipB [Sinomonas humi]|nr:lipoyl(octanoyl) transferase LipB [Sinomonas humi]
MAAPLLWGIKLVRMTLAFTRLGFAPDYVDYTAGLAAQRQLHDEVAAGEAPSTVLLLEHAAVYTAGKRTEDHERPLDGTPVVPVDRGGKLTWHGPGQLVGYPIVRLKEPRGVRAYVELLEDVMITVISEYGIKAEHVDGRSGVWVRADERGGDRKIAAIGISIHEGITGHGFAINCSNSLDPYEQIIACGITDAGTTTISAEVGREVGPLDIVDRIAEELARRAGEFVAEDRPADGSTAPAQTEGALL